MKTLITIICCIGFGVTIATIVIGQRNFEGLIVEKPYEAGLNWDETHRRRSELGWIVSIRETGFTLGRNDLAIEVFDKQGLPVEDAKVLVTVTRPATNAHNRTYETSGAKGLYRSTITIPFPGKWDINARIVRAGDDYAYTKSIYAKEIRP